MRPERKRGQPRSPVRENRTPGSVRGAPGDRRSYRAMHVAGTVEGSGSET
jgi:hypothetical protein